ncbi:MAG: hypothetical protein K6A23_11660 [Butyrivibrio sp.]|nr:hypothetical protein [Butyrivibrio sp.]
MKRIMYLVFMRIIPALLLFVAVGLSNKKVAYSENQNISAYLQDNLEGTFDILMAKAIGHKTHERKYIEGRDSLVSCRNTEIKEKKPSPEIKAFSEKEYKEYIDTKAIILIVALMLMVVAASLIGVKNRSV